MQGQPGPQIMYPAPPMYVGMVTSPGPARPAMRNQWGGPYAAGQPRQGEYPGRGPMRGGRGAGGAGPGGGHAAAPNERSASSISTSSQSRGETHKLKIRKGAPSSARDSGRSASEVSQTAESKKPESPMRVVRPPELRCDACIDLRESWRFILVEDGDRIFAPGSDLKS